MLFSIEYLFIDFILLLVVKCSYIIIYCVKIMREEEKIRLSKWMAKAGVASRRGSEKLIFSGRVLLNGEVAILPQTLVGSEDQIKVDGKLIGALEKKVYFLLNKPQGYLCTSVPRPGEKAVVSLFSKAGLRLFTVGRLDKETTGLLIVTNDGDFAQQVIHPSSDIEKEYQVTTDRQVSSYHMQVIKAGVTVEGTFVRPVSVKKVNPTTLKITVKEGKKREVRHLVQHAGLKVALLTRIRIGELCLGSLKEGVWREMTKKDKQLLFQKGK